MKSICDSMAATKTRSLLALVALVALLVPASSQSSRTSATGSGSANPILIEQQAQFSTAQLLPIQQQQQQQTHASTVTNKVSPSGQPIGVHLQPSFVYGARNKSINFTHLAYDELTNSVYVGATNWLFQLSGSNLRPEMALKTGPATENSRDCAPADCAVHLASVDIGQIPVHHAHGPDLSVPQTNQQFGRGRNASSAAAAAIFGASHRSAAGPRPSLAAEQQQQAAAAAPGASLQSQMHNNNYNKILAIDHESRVLVVCGSLNQGACRRHQLGQLANFSELIPLPVASNDEHSSSVALVVAGSPAGSSWGASGGRARAQAAPIMYVAATNSRLGPYREMVPPISARWLEPQNRAMQIIERSFTDSARIDISSELRDYYLVNYVHAFQHQDHVYFATVQRKSPLRQLEEWGHITRLARLCLADLSFQSYAEISLECRSNASPNSNAAGRASGPQPATINYNLLQDAQVTQASSHLAAQLGIRAQAPVLVGVFALSKDHTTKSQAKSAICLYPLERIEQTFNENIQSCFNGTSKARNMNYIAGSVNDCPRANGKPTNAVNICNEPIKLNGSIPLVANAVATYDSELLTSIAAIQAPTSALNQQASTSGSDGRRHAPQSARQHQVLLAGTSEGQLKRILLAGSIGQPIRGLEFESIQLEGGGGASGDAQTEAILSDLIVLPSSSNVGGSSEPSGARFALAATGHKLVKLRVNGCRAASLSNLNGRNQSVSLTDQCQACSQLQDPFCGWCSSLNACVSRDECIQQMQQQQTNPIHWQPFDQIRCADYEPVWPKFVALQSGSQQAIEVNVRLERRTATAKDPESWPTTALAFQLSRAQFTCHFDYLTYANRSLLSLQSRISGASTKATQARLNLHSSTVSVACPLPAHNQRPQPQPASGESRVRLLVRLAPPLLADPHGVGQLVRALGMRSHSQQSGRKEPESALDAIQLDEDPPTIERVVGVYDCSAHSTCRACLQAGQSDAGYSCAWCPLSNRCTFNASNPDSGCAATALVASSSTTTPSSASNSLRASHLAASLDPEQASVFGLSIERPAKCPAANIWLGPASSVAVEPSTRKPLELASNPAQAEILIPNLARRSVQLQLQAAKLQLVQSALGPKRAAQLKVECQFEIEMAKARVSAKLVHQPVASDASNSQTVAVVVCQELQFSYQEEIATQRAQVSVIINDNQAIESNEVILYKCHLFGVSPPALTSTLVSSASNGQQPSGGPNLHQQHSSAAWRAHEIFQLTGYSGQASMANGFNSARRNEPAATSDCSLCANVERKYQCVWCQNQCQHQDSCLDGHQITIGSSGCPPPRIDSIHPTSGPLEGGTLITIEGSNLGANEREIQDKITVASKPCQLVMYSVSTRIVCKTGPSPQGPQAATVFVGNRAGVTSAHDKFNYKPVYLTGVSPTVGPVSGGTRLYLTGSNLNIGSRTQIFLDDTPCAVDLHEMTSNQISCVTAPLVAPSMRISKLTLMIDNSTHFLPYPFTYELDPIITSIEPAESFVSGGRLIVISGHHLSSPRSTKLMLYHDQLHNIVNGTSCETKNDNIIYCMTPALPKDLIYSSFMMSYNQQQQQQQQELIGAPTTTLGQHMNTYDNQLQATQSVSKLFSYESGGFKMKMSLIMDDVKSVRNLDEYYHHLPHYITYYEDPVLFRLANQLIEYSDELVIQGENLGMKDLDKDMLISIGNRANKCALKSIQANQVVCEPPKKILPVYDPNTGRMLDRANLAIEGLIGNHLRFSLGHMQYTSQQYLPASAIPESQASMEQHRQMFESIMVNYDGHKSAVISPSDASSSGTSFSAGILIILSVIGIVIGLIATAFFGLSKFRQSKSEREYKRIQLQMGSLDINGQPINGLFDTIHITANQIGANNSKGFAHGAQQMTSRAIDYITGAANGGKNKLFYPISTPSFPPSPLTDISSLTGSANHAVYNQQLVKLTPNGTILNSIHGPASVASLHQQQHQQLYNGGPIQVSNSDSSSSQSSPSSSTRTASTQQQQHQRQLARISNGSSRNFSWTQEAPSTVLPYAVIEACNLTLEGKNAIKDYV